MCSKKVAVLLAAYNGQEFLQDQINSILGQVDVQVDIFISIDLSTDDTNEICHNFANRYENIHLLPLGLKFGGAAKNFYRLLRDVSFDNYDYVSFSDQDDIWLEDKLSTATKEIKSRNLDAYSSNVTAFWPDGKELLIEKSQPQREFDYLFEAAGPGCTYVFTRSLAEHIQRFIVKQPKVNEFILHDWFCYAFARIHGYKWFIDAKSKMRYRQHENNQVGVNNSLSALWHRAKYVFFGGGLAQVRLLMNLFPVSGLPDRISRLNKFDLKARFEMLFLFNQLRRKHIERLYVALILLTSLIKGL